MVYTITHNIYGQPELLNDVTPRMLNTPKIFSRERDTLVSTFNERAIAPWRRPYELNSPGNSCGIF